MKKLTLLALSYAAVGFASTAFAGTTYQATGPVLEVTDSKAAFFDAPNRFARCIARLHHVLRRQRLLERTACLDPRESIGPGQLDEIDPV